MAVQTPLYSDMLKTNPSGAIPKTNEPKTSSVSPNATEKPSKSYNKEAKQKQEKVCVVCGDNATGTHFAAMTCEGCKGFFRRSMKKDVQFSCAFDKNCPISKTNRKHCQACRLQKCLAVGMDASLIMSDESVNRKRELIRQNREKRAQIRAKKEQQELEMRMKENVISQDVTSIRMTMEDKHLIETLLEGHKASYDFSYDEYETFRGRDMIPAPADVDNDPSNMTLAWLMASLNPKPSKNKDTKLDDAEKKQVQPKVEANDKTASFPTEGDYPYVQEEPRDFLDIFSSLHGIPDTPIVPDEIALDESLLIQEFDSDLPSAPFSESNSSYSDVASNFPQFSPNESCANPQQQQQQLPQQPNMEQLNPNSMPFTDMHSGSEQTSFLQSLLMKQGISLSFMQDEKTRHLLQHFCDIMTWGIKKVIEFCKYIPEFQELTTVDQINLLRGGCLEMLVLRSYFAFAAEGNKYMSDKFQYTPMDFLQAGASAEFVEMYGFVHQRMRKLNLQVEEICMLISMVLFSPDRPGVEAVEKIDSMQIRVAIALRAYEYTHKSPQDALSTFTEILLLLPSLRTINVLFSNTILTLKGTNEDDINPLILEVNP